MSIYYRFVDKQAHATRNKSYTYTQKSTKKNNK